MALLKNFVDGVKSLKGLNLICEEGLPVSIRGLSWCSPRTVLGVAHTFIPAQNEWAFR